MGVGFKPYDPEGSIANARNLDTQHLDFGFKMWIYD